MKKIHIIFLLSAIITPNITFGADDQCQGKTEAACKDANCQWKADENVENGGICEPCGSGTVGINGECKQCEANQYIKDGKCKACPAPYKNSDPGSNKITDCYQKCEPTDITNGKKIYQSDGTTIEKVHYSESETDRKTCEYYETIVCNTVDNNYCQSYHFDTEHKQCVENWNISKLDNNSEYCAEKLSYYISNKWESQYCIKCIDTTHHAVPDETFNITDCLDSDGTSKYVGIKKCEANKQACSNLKTRDIDYYGNGTKSCDSPSGEYTWNSNENKYNYQDCKMTCRIKENFTTKKITYSYNSERDIWTSQDNGTLERCEHGYCTMKKNSPCEKAYKGYYAINNENECQKCPGGTTTKEDGATSIKDCMVSKETKFCNSKSEDSCFTLPIGDNVYLNPPAGYEQSI